MITIEEINKIVADYFNLPPELLLLNTRKRVIVYPRQIAMYFCTINCEIIKDKNQLFNEIAFFYKKDRTTVCHAEKKILELIQVDKFTIIDCNKIDQYINGVHISKEEIIQTIMHQISKRFAYKLTMFNNML